MSNPLGTPTRILDGRAKVTGDVSYAPDVNMVGLLHARFVTSLYAHANLGAIDTSQALAMPGVAAVLTAADLPDLPPSSRSKLLLARGRVVFMGQPIALVLALASFSAALDLAFRQKVVSHIFYFKSHTTPEFLPSPQRVR